MKDFQFIIQNFLKDHEKHKKYLALLLVLSIVVSFAVPFSLIMPAISMTGELICGMEEHIHSDECYELFCGLEESDEHLHNADCYTLVCDIPEHIHSQECYSDYQEENNFDFENLSPDVINISNVMDDIDEQGRTLVSNMNNGQNANNDESIGKLSEVSLLIGDGVEWAEACKNANDVIEAAKRKYFLGIASDFSIFLENNFRPLNSDTEGRVATGGDVFFDTTNNGWNYQIGNGDYAESIALKSTGDYNGRSNFAHIITKGGIKNINLISQGSNNGDNYIYEEDKYKRFVVSTDADLTNLSQFAHRASSTLYSNECNNHLVSNLNELAQFYKADLINFNETFVWLRQQSEKLSKKTATGTYEYKDESLSTDNSNDKGSRYTLILTGPGINSDINTVYFSLPNWDSDVRRIMFKDIPNNANLVVNCGGEKVIIGGTGDNDKMIYTYINGEMISNTGTNDKSTNNNEKSSKILYNFYQAVSDSDYNPNLKLSEDSSQKNKAGVYVNTNFNGTIFAPNADVRSEDGCDGHLSGSLIAKTFTGGLEFGYRPYRGGMEDILGSSMGYTIPVDKVVTGSGQWLAGAKFEIIDSENNVVNSFTSGEGTNFVDIPSKVDFTGGTDYKTSAKNLTGTYTIKEVSAPEGYIKTDTPYTVTITEEIQSDGLIETGSGTIPTHIIATVQFGSSTPFNIELKDTYSYDGSSSKQIRRELKIDNETFYLEIDNGQVSEVSKKDDTNKLAESGSVVTTTITENPDATTEKDIAVTVYQTDVEGNPLNDENGNPLTDDKGNPLPETQTTEVIVTDTPLQEYTIGCIRFESNDVDKGNLTFYYNGGESKTYDNVPIISDNYGKLFDLSNLSDLKYDGVVGIAISFDKDVSGSLRIQQHVGDNWDCIFGTNWNYQASFQANTIQYFNGDTNPADTTTSVSTVTEVVTTSITTVSYFTSYSVSSDVSYYDKYQTIIADPSNATTYTTTVEAKYYYNPDDIMMMPMPLNNPTFENRCGLLFKKVDSNRTPLSGATIELQYKNGDTYAKVTDTAIWNWTGSSFTIDPNNLELDKVYRFHEETAPAGYETAPDIYFQKTDTNTIVWGTAENSLTNTLDLTNDNDRTITMTDIKITGAKVKLKKTNEDGTTLLDGAKFKLYSADDETIPIYPTSGDGFIVTDGEIDLYNTFKNAEDGTYNSTYIQNGYLKPGLYYLEEVTPPSGYQASNEPFYFTIKENSGTYEVETGLPQYVSFTVSNEWGNEIWAYGSASNVTKIEIKVTSPADGASLVLYDYPAFHGKTATIQNGVATFEFATPLSSVGNFKIQNTDYNSGVTVQEVKVYGDSSSGGSSSGGSSTSDFIYELNEMAFSNSSNQNINIKKLTLYYVDGKTSFKDNITYSDNNSWWQQLDLSGLSKKDVVGAIIETGDGYGAGFQIQKKDGTPIWNTPTNLEANQIYNFGITDGQDYTASTDPDTPTGGEGGNTSNNTEEGAIDKDTTAPAGYVGLIAKNSPVGDKTSITVKKEWVDDTGYETTLRPDKITVQLYRSTTPNLALTALNDSNSTKIENDIDITQDTNGKWEYTWTNLDTKDSNNQNYYYYVKEEVTALNDYTVSYENNGIPSGDVKIKNTLKTVNITVNKVWKPDTLPEGVTNPSSVTVKLQTSSDGANWTDVSGKTLTLNSSNSWRGTFEKLPAGKYYQVVETNIPTGWTASYSDENGKQFSSNVKNITVTNTISLASLNIKKNWVDNVGDVRPENIKINLYRSTTPPASSVTSNSVQPISLKEPANNYEDYSRLLQYSLYFYDAQMCGDDVGKKSDLNWRKDCHTYDSVLGGYHDAGDHVMFGLPQGYTASTLGWSYYENNTIYDGLGQTEHYQKIMKRFCDFFVASTTIENGEVTKFLYQKGAGGTDHSYWGSAENQTQEQRGNLLYTTNSASDIAAEYAAALAQYAINFPNDSRKEDYLNCAKALYAFSTKYDSRISNGFYDSGDGGRCTDEQAWAAAWLYLATNDNNYKKECKETLDTITSVPNKGYFWDDVALGAMIVYKKFIDNSYDWSVVTDYLSDKCDPNSSFVILDEWGSARHNTALQMIALSASKVDGVDYTDWCKKQMNYILGDNSISSNGKQSTCFVVGFADNSAKYPHHRGASCISGYGNDYNNNTTYPNGHELVGALVGGPNSSYSYNDNFKDDHGNEVALDYNATLVGAAAALFAKYGTGTLVTNAAQIGTKNEVKNVYLQPNPVLTVYGKSTMYKGNTQTLNYTNQKGTVTWSSSDSDILTVDENGLVTAVSNGKATITATDSFDSSTATFEITVTLTAVTPDIPEDVELVKTITLTSSNWEETLSDLPITDGQGKTYHYYIAEVDSYGIIGEEGKSQNISGYVPISYSGNGSALNKTSATELSVTNKKSDVDEGSMPSTGGTGTQPYKVIGMVMTGGALIMLGIRRRKKQC